MALVSAQHLKSQLAPARVKSPPMALVMSQSVSCRDGEVPTPGKPVNGHFTFSNYDQLMENESLQTTMRSYDLYMIYSAELASVNLRVYLYAFKFGPDPYEECAVDLTNLYGPDCVLRKHGILPRNFAWGEPEPTTDPSERHANDVLTFIRRIFERAAERAVILQSD